MGSPKPAEKPAKTEKPAKPGKKKPDPVNEASRESFPASDPPSFNPGTAAPAPLPEDPPAPKPTPPGRSR